MKKVRTNQGSLPFFLTLASPTIGSPPNSDGLQSHGMIVDRVSKALLSSQSRPEIGDYDMLDTFGGDVKDNEDGEDPGDTNDDMTLVKFQVEAEREALAPKGYA